MNDSSSIAPSQATRVFISYSHLDRAWVDEYLCPLLDAANFGVHIDHRDFQIGRTFLQNMREGVEQSDHMMIVLTPDWLRSMWTAFEAEVALQQPADERRLLMLKLRPCDVSRELKWLTFLDVTDFDRRDDEMLRLLRQLGADNDQLARAKERIARKGLAALRELMHEPRVQKEVAHFSHGFSAIVEKIGRVDRCKLLHELFHTAESEQRNIQRIFRQIVDGRAEWSEALTPALLLRNAVKKLIAGAEGTFDAGDVPWIGLIRPACDELASAARARDLDRLQFWIDQIGNVVGQYLKELNDEIVALVKQMPLQQLVDSLHIVDGRIKRFEFDPPAREQYDDFLKGLEPLRDLGDIVRRQVHNHNMLQQVALQRQRPVKQSNIEYQWRMTISGHVRALRAEGDGPPLARLMELGQQVDARIANAGIVRDEVFFLDLHGELQEFDAELQLLFALVDNYLHTDVCKRLKQFGDVLEAILTKMQNDD